MVDRRNRFKKEREDLDAHAMNISGGNKPKKDSDIKKTEKITNGEHVSTRLVSKEPISTTKESTNNNSKIKISAIIAPLKAVLFMKE